MIENARNAATKTQAAEARTGRKRVTTLEPEDKLDAAPRLCCLGAWLNGAETNLTGGGDVWHL